MQNLLNCITLESIREYSDTPENPLFFVGE